MRVAEAVELLQAFLQLCHHDKHEPHPLVFKLYFFLPVSKVFASVSHEYLSHLIIVADRVAEQGGQSLILLVFALE